MVLLEFSITPLGAGESVGKYVAKAVDVIDASGLDYQTHAMGTVVEGELPELLALLQKCIDTMSAECPRVTVTAKFDCRQGSDKRLRSKVASLEKKLGRPVKK